ncbi:MAG: hypothetical protein NPIRA02_09580 [Nitrospirales bacterium]|nr:MAG: hypothetical protein NPIRA02_09580 [Nitrospirales bacterium]
MEIPSVVIVLGGVVVGLGAALTGLGGGFLMVPFLLFLGFTAQKAVGTSFLGIVLISLSALVAQNKLAHVDYKVGLLLGVGGIVGAQIGTHLLEHVSTDQFKNIFAMMLMVLSVYLLVKT